MTIALLIWRRTGPAFRNRDPINLSPHRAYPNIPKVWAGCLWLMIFGSSSISAKIFTNSCEPLGFTKICVWLPSSHQIDYVLIQPCLLQANRGLRSLSIADTFKRFLGILEVNNAQAILDRYGEITCALNKKSRDTEAKTANMLQVGTYGRLGRLAEILLAYGRVRGLHSFVCPSRRKRPVPCLKKVRFCLVSKA
ncbi:hypothetical protein [Erythrobacter sp. R86502]|uniref:hypothetical protein n=1 Tax=Erythrobacter sp. R86502 TaxID=3093846 RepID=UPI0036D301B8